MNIRSESNQNQSAKGGLDGGFAGGMEFASEGGEMKLLGHEIIRRDVLVENVREVIVSTSRKYFSGTRFDDVLKQLDIFCEEGAECCLSDLKRLIANIAKYLRKDKVSLFMDECCGMLDSRITEIEGRELVRGKIEAYLHSDIN